MFTRQITFYTVLILLVTSLAFSLSENDLVKYYNSIPDKYFYNNLFRYKIVYDNSKYYCLSIDQKTKFMPLIDVKNGYILIDDKSPEAGCATDCYMKHELAIFTSKSNRLYIAFNAINVGEGDTSVLNFFLLNENNYIECNDKVLPKISYSLFVRNNPKDIKNANEFEKLYKYIPISFTLPRFGVSITVKLNTDFLDSTPAIDEDETIKTLYTKLKRSIRTTIIHLVWDEKLEKFTIQ